MRPRESWLPLAVLLAVGLTGACAATSAPQAAAPATTGGATTEEYRPGVEADVHLPEPMAPGPRPVLVLVPGGSWQTADRSGLLPLAGALAERGIVVVTARYRAAEDGVEYPVPVEDVACAVSWAAQRAAAEGVTPTPLAVGGHSAGAHLAALAALAPDEYADDCPAPAATPRALVGLAGPYDLSAFGEMAQTLLGASRAEAPEAWRQADPLRRADEQPGLDVLLVHGADDELVSPAFTRVFARALQEGGHGVTAEVVPGADHLGLVVAPEVAGPTIASWLQDLSSASPGSTAPTPG